MGYPQRSQRRGLMTGREAHHANITRSSVTAGQARRGRNQLYGSRGTSFQPMPPSIGSNETLTSNAAMETHKQPRMLVILAAYPHGLKTRATNAAPGGASGRGVTRASHQC